MVNRYSSCRLKSLTERLFECPVSSDRILTTSVVPRNIISQLSSSLSAFFISVKVLVICYFSRKKLQAIDKIKLDSI